MTDISPGLETDPTTTRLPIPEPPPVATGLEGVIAAETRLSRVDGEAGELILAGFPLEELAPNARFEETLHLFWNGRLPPTAELDTLRAELASHRSLPAPTEELISAGARGGVPLIDILRMATDSLSLDLEAEPNTREGAQEARRVAWRLVAAMPAIVASAWRRSRGKEPVAPNPDLGHAANYLYMLSGEAPSAERVRGLETYLNTVVDHGFNASTFTARVIVSTRSDLISAITGALGALKGPLHGGAPGPALDMVFEIGSEENAEPYLREKLRRGERLMGFGHRIYKVRDPRADVLARAAARLAESGENRELYELARRIEAIALELLEEAKPGRCLETNVEFYTALLLHGLGLDSDLFTPTFALGRVVGWCAHAFEQLDEGRLIRPRSRYVGPTDRSWAQSPASLATAAGGG